MPLLPLYWDNFWDPLTEDVEELLGRFQRADSVRYEVFAAIWREMSFSDVFLGITVMSDMKRFCRVAMATAAKYFLPDYSYQIRVGGLYLMYGFYNTQQCLSPVSVRLALKDLKHVQKFLQDSVAAGHHDVVYILQKLFDIKAIHYTAMPHFLTFQKHVHPKKESVCAEFLERTARPQELISEELLEEITNIQNHYEKLKATIGEINDNVAMTRRDLATHLRDATLEFIQWQEKKFPQPHKNKHPQTNQAKSDGGEPSRANTLFLIKQKSFRACAESRRYGKAVKVDSCGSGEEQHQEVTAIKRKKRPLTLRARTYRSLTVIQEDTKSEPWLLTVPEQVDGTVEKTN